MVITDILLLGKIPGIIMMIIISGMKKIIGFSEEEEDVDDEKEMDNKAKNVEGFVSDVMGSGSGTNDQKTTKRANPVQLISNLDYSSGKINPLLKQTFQRIITIDSAYRDLNNLANSISTDFTLNFNEVLKDVVSLKLYAIQIPYNWYTISNDYGSNFIYIKGVSPGINDENHDYKITIRVGNYNQSTLSDEIKYSMKLLPSLYPDVSFGSTTFNYDVNGCLGSFVLDIQNAYNEYNYTFGFSDTFYSPNPPVRNNNRYSHLNSFLGFNYSSYSLSSVFSSRKITTNIDNINSKFLFNTSNNYITLIQYSGISEDGVIREYHDPNTVIQSFNVLFPITGLQSQNSMLSIVNSVLNKDSRFVNANVQFETIDGTDITGNSIDNDGNYRFVWNLKWNRNKGYNIPGSKWCLKLPQEDTNNPVWVGAKSCFQFTSLSNEIQSLVSETYVPSSNFVIGSNVYMLFTLNNPLYNVGNVNDISCSINPSFIGYTLTEYISEINASFVRTNDSWKNNNNNNDVFVMNYTNTEINNTDSKFHLKVDMSQIFYTSNFVVDISGTLLEDFLEFSSSDINRNVSLNDINNVFQSTSRYRAFYPITNKNALLLKVYANPANKRGISSDVSYNIYTTYRGNADLNDLPNIINNAFGKFFEDTSPSFFPLKNTNISVSLSTTEINKVNCVLTIDIEKQISQEEYILTFYDNENNSWKNNLFLNTTGYVLANYTYGTNYSDIIANDFVNEDRITLSDGNGRFFLNPVDISSGVLPFVVPDGTYTRTQLFNTINNLFSERPETNGTTISIITEGGVSYTKIRWNINKIFTTADYKLVFYDLYSFVSCFLGAASVRNATSDTTLGYITGFTNLTTYYLNSDNYYTNINSGITYYYDMPTNTLTKNIYAFDSSIPNRFIATLTGDSTISVNLYKNLMVVLDDYNQNHLNDGLITITQKDKNLSLPSYADRKKYICDPFTDKPLNIGITTPASNNLTQNQLYSINQIINTQNTPKGYTNPGVYVKDIFALIPMKVSGMKPGDIYVELGGTLQNQNRLYFGPVNIHRMAVKLLNDRGEILDLNGANWSLQLLCEQLYQNVPLNNA